MLFPRLEGGEELVRRGFEELLDGPSEEGRRDSHMPAKRIHLAGGYQAAGLPFTGLTSPFAV